MNKKLKNFLIAWCVELVIFNLFAFLIPVASAKTSLFNESVFWFEYAFLMVTFLIQLAVCYFALRTKEEEPEEEPELSTKFIRFSTAEAESIMARCKTEQAKAECKKVYEAFRYADPVSTDDLKEIESDIETNLSALRKAVVNGNEEEIKETANELLVLIKDRSIKCKLLK